MQCAKPNTILAPLQFGLGVQLHKAFASRFLIETLYRLGFSCSYHEVRKFLKNAAVQQGIDLPPASDTESLQFVADNVDHNTVTLDGLNTFHGMVIIAAVTPAPTTQQTRRVPRGEVKSKDIRSIGRIGIYFYR